MSKLYLRTLRQHGQHLGIAVLCTTNNQILPSGCVRGFYPAGVDRDEVVIEHGASVVRGNPVETRVLPIAKDSPLRYDGDNNGPQRS